MKNTKTCQTEKLIVGIYEKRNENIEAKKQIRIIMLCFQMLSIFTEEDHSAIVQKLYFSKNNIVKNGVRETAKAVFIPERTLQYYRRKYCEIIDIIVASENVL